MTCVHSETITCDRGSQVDFDELSQIKFSQDDFSQKRLLLFAIVIFGSMTLLLKLSALPCAYMESLKQGEQQ